MDSNVHAVQSLSMARSSCTLSTVGFANGQLLPFSQYQEDRGRPAAWTTKIRPLALWRTPKHTRSPFARLNRLSRAAMRVLRTASQGME